MTGNPLRRFLLGLTYPFRGIRLVLTHPSTWPYLAVPTLITTGALLTALYVAWQGVPWLLAKVWVPEGDVWVVEVLWLSLVLVLRALAFLVVGIALYFSAGLVAVPFNDRLSERIETLVAAPGPPPSGRISSFAALATSVSHSALSLMLYLLAMAGLLLLELVPGPGSALHIGLGLLATSLFLGREMMDGCMSRRRMSYGAKLRLVRDNLGAVVGFGLVAAALLWLPLLNFVLLPMMVAGGTLLFCDLERAAATRRDPPLLAQSQREPA